MPRLGGRCFSDAENGTLAPAISRLLNAYCCTQSPLPVSPNVTCRVNACCLKGSDSVA